MKFSVFTFGCKVNQGESQSVISELVNYGYTFYDSPFSKSVDVVIVNSCTVTAESDRKMRQCINKIRRVNKDCVIVLMGCMPQAFPGIASKFKEVQIIIGNNTKSKLPMLIDKYFKDKRQIIEINDINSMKKFEDIKTPTVSNRFRAFLKIEDGCDRFCSYCIIPYARGRVRSKSLESIKRDVINLSENGYKEIVLTGINLSSYGKDLNCGLEEAVKEVGKIPEVERIRLGSLEPDMLNERLINELCKEPKLCPQFHLSLQSGSDNTLKKMRRLYTRADYIKTVKFLREKFSDATFTTDLMVGFPGETESEFEESLSIIKEVKFLKVHVFPYSIRPGTLASKLDNQIDKVTKTKRVQKVVEISKKTSKIVLEEFANREMQVLYESYDSEGFYKGYTSNYILVRSQSSEDIRGKLLKTALACNQGDHFLGNIL